MNTKQDILAILEAHQGESVSGEQIARELHITRSAVWKGVRALKEEGCPITAGTNRGYLLAADSDIFSPGSVTTRLHGSAARLQVEIRPEVTSTNTVLKEEARLGAPDGKVLIALRQSAGKGRMGRSFYSPQDTGLYMSLLLRPKLTLAHSTLLTTVAAVAVAQAVDDVLGIAPPKPEPKSESFGTDSPQMEHSGQAAIKWVNDVYFHGKKICGILTEAAADFESGTLEYAVVGIGINLTDPTDGFPEEIRHVAGSLYGRQPAPKGIRPALAAAVLNYFMRYYERLPETAFLTEYRRRSFLLGQDIYVLGGLLPDGSHQSAPRLAHADRIDEQLRLVVTYQDGTTEALSSGEVSTRLVSQKL